MTANYTSIILRALQCHEGYFHMPMSIADNRVQSWAFTFIIKCKYQLFNIHSGDHNRFNFLSQNIIARKIKFHCLLSCIYEHL